jgi:GT2 family glycosyltransferase
MLSNVAKVPTEPVRPPVIDRTIPRVRVRGKFLYAGDRKVTLRGTTYGTFAPNQDGEHVHDPLEVERDFGQMAANGFNAIRTYTVPERWMFDAAQRHGLWVMVGLPWEQHVTFLDDRAVMARIEERIRAGVRTCAGHPAVLCYAVGNEVPAPIVRWHGALHVERFLERLARIARSEDPDALLTYVNYPTTEYLSLDFCDLFCFNVYLEASERLEAYLARLHNLAGERPLILAELGLDSRRNGETTQADYLSRQVRTAFEAGCAGAFVFAWTDEWHRGGFEIDDWDFGLTRRDRVPKPALAAIRDAFNASPFAQHSPWPRISVIVCAYNAESTIRECLNGLRAVDYPDFETIVVNDGSEDRTAAIAREFDVRLISTPNRGLSNARNTGLAAATGEIVAYLDSDAFPDPDWLRFLAAAFLQSDHAGVGGPNLAPPGGTPRDACFAHAPGGPTHVLLSDRVAEHIPGCNMAFYKAELEAVGGFDPLLRIAGDDVDVCWRLQERGRTLGFSPAALVWHHRRTTVRSYWKQQRGYGRAEALLERKWPEKYNGAGHVGWSGRIYARGVTAALGIWRDRIYYGSWGSAPFQQRERLTPRFAWWLPMMPEWLLVVASLAIVSALGVLWRPLLLAAPLLAVAVALPVANAIVTARRVRFTAVPPWRQVELRALVALLHLAQPLARLLGRLEYGLTPWRKPFPAPWRLRTGYRASLWSEQWKSAADWLASLAPALRAAGAAVQVGSAYDDWDLAIRGGMFGSARLRFAIEEHGAGRQLLRFRVTPVWSQAGLVSVLVLMLAASCAVLTSQTNAGFALIAAALAVIVQINRDAAAAISAFERAIGTAAPGGRADSR